MFVEMHKRFSIHSRVGLMLGFPFEKKYMRNYLPYQFDFTLRSTGLFSPSDQSITKVVIHSGYVTSFMNAHLLDSIEFAPFTNKTTKAWTETSFSLNKKINFLSSTTLHTRSQRPPTPPPQEQLHQMDQVYTKSTLRFNVQVQTTN